MRASVYLPLPVPLLDVYGKGGVARLNYRASSSNGCLACSLFNADYSETRVAYGGGAQLKLDRLAVRVEYERISASNGDPSLIAAIREGSQSIDSQLTDTAQQAAMQ